MLCQRLGAVEPACGIGARLVIISFLSGSVSMAGVFRYCVVDFDGSIDRRNRTNMIFADSFLLLIRHF